jgi:hypothetical protein
VLAQEKHSGIQAWLYLLRCLAKETEVSLGFTATKLTKLYPHKIMYGREFKWTNYEAKNPLCNWLLQNVHDRITDQQLLLITDDPSP